MRPEASLSTTAIRLEPVTSCTRTSDLLVHLLGSPPTAARRQCRRRASREVEWPVEDPPNGSHGPNGAASANATPDGPLTTQGATRPIRLRRPASSTSAAEAAANPHQLHPALPGAQRAERFAQDPGQRAGVGGFWGRLTCPVNGHWWGAAAKALSHVRQRFPRRFEVTPGAGAEKPSRRSRNDPVFRPREDMSQICETSSLRLTQLRPIKDGREPPPIILLPMQGSGRGVRWGGSLNDQTRNRE